MPTKAKPSPTVAAVARAAGFRPVTAKQAAATSARLRARYAQGWTLGTLWTDALWEASAEAARRLVHVADGAVVRTEFPHAEVTTRLFHDPADPSRLYYAPSEAFPAALFVALPVDADALRTVVAEHSPRAGAAPVRAFLGYASDLRVPDVRTGKMGAFDKANLENFYVWSPAASFVTRRTRFGASRFSHEIHDDELVVWDLAYAPCATTRATIEAANARFGAPPLPTDLPIDLFAAMFRLPFVGLETIRARARGARATSNAKPGEKASPEHRAGAVDAWVAIGWTAIESLAGLEELAEVPDELLVRTLADVAYRWDWESLAWRQLLARAADDASAYAMSEPLAEDVAEAFATRDRLPIARRSHARTTQVVLAPGAGARAVTEIAARHGLGPGESRRRDRTGPTSAIFGRADGKLELIVEDDAELLVVVATARGAKAARERLVGDLPARDLAAARAHLALASRPVAERLTSACALAALADASTRAEIAAFAREQLASRGWRDRFVGAPRTRRRAARSRPGRHRARAREGAEEAGPRRAPPRARGREAD